MLSALTAMLDTATVVSICSEGSLKRQADLTLAMGRHALVDIAEVFSTKSSPNPEDRLKPQEFEKLRRLVGDNFRGWKVEKLSTSEMNKTRELYESCAEALGIYLLIALPSWLPDKANLKIGNDLPDSHHPTPSPCPTPTKSPTSSSVFI